MHNLCQDHSPPAAAAALYHPATVDDLRAQFPVLERCAYLNSGTNGPVPRRALETTTKSLRLQAEQGRAGQAYFDRCLEQIDLLRGRIAELLGCDAAEIAMTGSTTDGVNSVLNALELGPADEVLTSEEEHPGVLAPLAALRERRGVTVRTAPFAELAGAVGPRTRLVACSHVSWITGAVVDSAALAATDALVLLDGAQGLGAVPADVRALGCDFYAASGQKWLCGPNGVGYLYVRAGLAGDLPPSWPGYGVLAEGTRPFDLELHPDARRLGVGFPAPHHVDWALASLDVLEGAGFEAIHRRGVELAAHLALGLGDRVRPRGASTLVSWEVADPEAEAARLHEAGFVLRYLPRTGTVRASVGGWSSEAEVEGLLELAAA
jgi:selenocysteine lyase/cysteine desulfurase